MRKVVGLTVLAGLLAVPAWWLASGVGEGLQRQPPPTDDAPTLEVPAAPPPSPTLAGAPRAEAPPSRATPVDLAAVDRDRDVHGVVVDPGGAPIEGARLTALTRRSTRAGGVGPFRSTITTHGETTSASDGSFAIRLERGAAVHLRAEAPGHGTVETPFVAAGARVRVVLGPAVRLVVVVRTESGEPVAGAETRFFQSGGFMVNAPRVAQAFHYEGATGPDGRGVWEDLPGAVWGWLEVLHPRWGSPGWTRVNLPAGGEHVQEIVLPAGRVVRGRVTDQATGRPIVGATVGAGWVRSRPVRTDAEGRYEFPGWTGAGTPEIYAGAPDYVLQGISVGSSEEVDFALVRGRRGRGRVLDAERRPLGGATVKAGAKSDPGGYLVGHATTAADGTFEFVGLDPEAEYRITALHDGFGPLAWTPPQPPDATSPLEIGDLVLRPAWRVEGVVRDGEGRPAEGMEVRLGGHPEQRVTDDLGRFRFRDVGTATYVLRLTGAGRETVEREVRVAEADVTDLEFQVAGGRLLEVSVEADGDPVTQGGVALTLRGADGILRHGYPDERGRALLLVPEGESVLSVSGWPEGWMPPPPQRLGPGDAGATVALRRAARIEGVVLGPDGTPVARASLRIRIVGEEDRLAVADLEGRFRAYVPPGSRAEIQFQGLLDAQGRLIPLRHGSPWFGEARDVAAGRSDMILRLQEVARDRTLRVQVLDPEGLPAAGIHVRWDDGAARTDHAGQVAFEGLPARPLSVTAFPPRAGILAARALDLVPEGQEVVLRFRAGLVIQGRVAGPAGPVAGAGVQVLRAGRAFAFGQSGTDGAFALTVDPEGEFPVEIRAVLPGDRSREITVQVPTPPTGPLEIRAP